MQIETLPVPVDFSDCSKAAWNRASTLAEKHGARLHLLHAVPPIPYAAPAEFSVPVAVLDEIQERTAARLAEWAEQGPKDVVVTHEVSRQRAVDAITAAVDARANPLVVMGTHGHTGLKHAFLGSVAERTIRTVPCAVMAVKEEGEEASRPIRRVLVCTDFSDHANEALDAAISLCSQWGAECHLVHAVHPLVRIVPEMPLPEPFLGELMSMADANLEKARARVLEAGLEGTTNLVQGNPSAAIVDLAGRHALDLIVLGTRGATGLEHALLGSVTDRVLRQVRCSVLAVKTHA